MPSAANLTAESRLVALFVGPKHSGKTCAAASWMTPESKRRVKFIDADGRIRGLLGAKWIDRDRIDYEYYPPRIASNRLTFFERVNQDLEAMLVDINNGKCMYETHVTDSMTAFCKNLILDAIPLSHKNEQGGEKGRKIGPVSMAGPEDYGFESTGSDAYVSFLRSIPLNVIVTGHVIPKYDKPMIVDSRGRTVKDTYAESVVSGEKLSLRDKIGANISIYFDHIFRFERKIVGGDEKFFVEIIGDIACTSFPGFEPGQYDITGKNFREFVLGKVKGS